MFGRNEPEVEINETEERRRTGSLVPEKMLAVLVSSASLAFVVFSSAMGAYDRLRDDTELVNDRVIVIDHNLTAIRGSYTEWVERLVNLERELGAMREKSALLSERLVRCESGTEPKK